MIATLRATVDESWMAVMGVTSSMLKISAKGAQTVR
jgi:hypothetical protein